MNAFFSFFGGVVSGGLLSWLITHIYYRKSSADQRTEIDNLKKDLLPKNSLADFERLLVKATWREDRIDNVLCWICDADNTFQIRQGERSRDFSERWTTVYPDRNGAAYPVYLSINNNIIKEVTFVSLDGGRIFVPMTEMRPGIGGETDFFWNMNSLEVKICRIIGYYYIYKDLEGVAGMSRVTMVANGA